MEFAPAVLGDALGIASVHIRAWQSANAEALDPGWLAALSVEARAKRWEDIIAAKESRTVVSRHAGGITGFISFGKCRDEDAVPTQGEIWALYAAPKVWGQGIGRALLEHASSELCSAGFKSTSLWVLAANHRGIKFYESCGFERVPGSGKFFELGGRQVEEVAYVRRLDA
jgi:ribosomal protein S18 acetylase RimI-like enzyme